MMNKRGFFIPPLAYALIVIFVIILIATFVPSVKQTIIDITGAFTGAR